MKPSSKTRADYFSWEAAFLRHLRAAFVLDRVQAVRERRSPAFVDGRIALIDEVLERRERP